MSTRQLLFILTASVMLVGLASITFSRESLDAARGLKLTATRVAGMMSGDDNTHTASTSGSDLPLDPNLAATTNPSNAKEALSNAASSQELTAIQPSPDSSLTNVKPRRIGIFVSDSPIDNTSLIRLNSYSSLGVDTILNYSMLDGTPSQINHYLDKADSLGIKVIFSLKDLYDQLDPSNYHSLYTYPLGDSNQSAAINAVRQFSSHPAVWGFSINDERPESPADLILWQATLQRRYNLIKQNTSKPVMMVLVGATSPSAIVRAQFLRSLRSSTDTFALDYYPIPFQPSSFIRDIGKDLVTVKDSDGWFIAQAFSWSSYLTTARGLGFNTSLARFPTAIEMINMSRLALNNGAHNIMFYSYFDIANHPVQLNALRQTIKALRN